MNTNYENHFNNCTFLKQFLYPDVENILDNSQENHPLRTLILSNTDNAVFVKTNTDICLKHIYSFNPDWLNDKRKIVLTENDYKNISATLGEIRAYGELLWIWGDKVKALKEGSDFIIEDDNFDVHVEIHAPQHSPKGQPQHLETLQSKNLIIEVSHTIPFGKPERNGIDNIQGEAVSNLASIKGKEHQFSESEISILWLDLQDMDVWPVGFGLEQCDPIGSFKESLTSGALWNAIYAKKNDYIYESFSFHGKKSTVYQMEFDGRFQQKTKIDFIVVSFPSDQIVFQNHNSKKTIPNEFVKKLYHLFHFNLSLSWLDWPNTGSLEKKVEIAREAIKKYKTVFKN
ncbi:MAG: hypothetical protein OEZ36_12445 [Spirochaetota bacterium]|nr:hypothetical protein [Spirochaetota bacterium]